jgi:hypothetical protein
LLAESWEGNTQVDNFDAVIASHGMACSRSLELS